MAKLSWGRRRGAAAVGVAAAPCGGGKDGRRKTGRGQDEGRKEDRKEGRKQAEGSQGEVAGG
ncbi:hypothetical protein [Kitasatospora azatica]|uniref:hypothetical protein n=1 Tax=Kitasatospora azatica TaxID=58347 RepID=UPI0012FC73FF|nr:hypothetical protein [Kitasatospora azatica]